jgi:hypothetical protein
MTKTSDERIVVRHQQVLPATLKLTSSTGLSAGQSQKEGKHQEMNHTLISEFWEIR